MLSCGRKYKRFPTKCRSLILSFSIFRNSFCRKRKFQLNARRHCERLWKKCLARLTQIGRKWLSFTCRLEEITWRRRNSHSSFHFEAHKQHHKPSRGESSVANSVYERSKAWWFHSWLHETAMLHAERFWRAVNAVITSLLPKGKFSEFFDFKECFLECAIVGAFRHTSNQHRTTKTRAESSWFWGKLIA